MLLTSLCDVRVKTVLVGLKRAQFSLMTLGAWTQVQNDSCIPGKYQIAFRQNVNIEQCRSFCEKRTACLSVDYHPGLKHCYLNNADSNTTQVSSRCNGYQYTEPVKSKLAKYCYNILL